LIEIATLIDFAAHFSRLSKNFVVNNSAGFSSPLNCLLSDSFCKSAANKGICTRLSIKTQKAPRARRAQSFLCCARVFSPVNEQIMQKRKKRLQLFARKRDNKSSATEKQQEPISRAHIAHSVTRFAPILFRL
jgi:hypothetical protein